MPVAARSAAPGAQPDAGFPAPARRRDRGVAPRGEESGGERQLRQAGEAGRRGRWVASSAAPFLPAFSSSSPPPPASSVASSPAAGAAVAASTSPSAASLLPALPRTRARVRSCSGFPGLAMSGGSGRLPPPAALCPPPPLHGPSLPEAGARSQGRGSPAGHGAPRGAPGARAPPPGERERVSGGRGAGPGVPPPAGSAAGPQGRGVALRSARGPSPGGGHRRDGTARRANSLCSEHGEANRGGGWRQAMCRPAGSEALGAACEPVPGAATALSPTVGRDAAVRTRAARSAGARAGASGSRAAAAGAPQPRAPARGAAAAVALCGAPCALPCVSSHFDVPWAAPGPRRLCRPPSPAQRPPAFCSLPAAPRSWKNFCVCV